MNLYRGHWLLGLGVGFFLIAIGLAITLPKRGTLLDFIMVLAIALSIICSLMSIALADRLWVPKWEREEKRTGRQPGDE